MLLSLSILKVVRNPYYPILCLQLKFTIIFFQAVPSKVKVGEKVTVSVSFINSLPKELTECVLSIEGVGLQRPREITISR